MGRWFPILWLSVILGATLIPLEPTEDTPPIRSVLCGEGLAADGWGFPRDSPRGLGRPHSNVGQEPIDRPNIGDGLKAIGS